MLGFLIVTDYLFLGSGEFLYDPDYKVSPLCCLMGSLSVFLIFHCLLFSSRIGSEEWILITDEGERLSSRISLTKRQSLSARKIVHTLYESSALVFF